MCVIYSLCKVKTTSYGMKLSFIKNKIEFFSVSCKGSICRYVLLRIELDKCLILTYLLVR